MNKTIVKVLALCTLAMSLLIAGATTMHTVDSGVAVCHDGPHHEGVEK